MPDRRLTGWRLAQAVANRSGARLSFSQEGEDSILARYFEGNSRPGFFVDVGAHHPIRFSNTFHLYLRGWRGINLDAQPGSMQAFDRLRPRDINLEAAVGQEAGVLTLTQFDEPALNTLDRSLVASRVAAGYRVVGTTSVNVVSLGSVLDRHRPAATPIDLMTIDVEGLDLDVLASNDWGRHRPRVLCVESLREQRADEGDATLKFCEALAYRQFAATHNTIFLESSGG
jgi:FkbM family methyltransferase